MKPWHRIDETKSPDGTLLTLMERDGDYTIRVNGTDLMSTRETASEESLAEIGCKHLDKKGRHRILIGGLGMGYTLRSALRLLPASEIVVAELLPAVVRWNQNPEFPFSRGTLTDRRVACITGDVVEVVRTDKKGFDAILLDVDNGPHGLTMENNSRIYQRPGLEIFRKALRPNGRLSIWTASQAPRFEKLLAQCGYITELHTARSHNNSGGRRSIYLAHIPSARR